SCTSNGSSLSAPGRSAGGARRVTDPGRAALISAPGARPVPLSFRVKTCPCCAPRGSNAFSTGAAASHGETQKKKRKTDGDKGKRRRTGRESTPKLFLCFILLSFKTSRSIRPNLRGQRNTTKFFKNLSRFGRILFRDTESCFDDGKIDKL